MWTLSEARGVENPYFGDINDFRKYALLRHLNRSSFGRIGVAWMLTPDDGGTNWNLRAYLDDEKRFAAFDPELFHSLRELLRKKSLSVHHFERERLLPSASYYSAIVPDAIEQRREWRRGLQDHVEDAELVFVDPDNGIEVPSVPMGRRRSSKFVAWEELEELWTSGCSLLIYQHFRREKRLNFANRLAGELRARTGTQLVDAFRTPHVLFLLAAQTRHASAFAKACKLDARSWRGQVECMGLSAHARG